MNDLARRQLGCGVVAEDPVFWITCPRCAGTPGARGGCATCDGEGIVGRYECPRPMARKYGPFLTAFDILRQYGLWPNAGGLEDQDVLFVDAVQVASSELAAIEREEAEEARRKSQTPAVTFNGGGPTRKFSGGFRPEG